MDCVDCVGLRYQVKYRSPDTLNVDVNNWDFDQLVLVNLDENWQLAGMWQISREELTVMLAERAKFRKWQVTQSRLKRVARQVA